MFTIPILAFTMSDLGVHVAPIQVFTFDRSRRSRSAGTRTSGGGFHCYWLLRDPLPLDTAESRAEACGWLRRLALAVGGDRQAAEPARILRIPGTLNHKYSPARPVQIVHFEPALRYRLADLVAHLPEEPAEASSASRFELPADIPAGERNQTLYRAGRSYVARSLSRDEVLFALLAHNTHRCRPPLPELEVRMLADWVWSQRDRPDFARNGHAATPAGSPWAEAQPACDFINAREIEVPPLFAPILYRGAVTEAFSPRGIGKTQIAYGIAVALSRAGYRVLLLDRDNPPREIRRRLRAWGASDLTTLKVLTRDKVPPLTDAEAWKNFPADYDFVIVDSLDATAEGVGEKDSAKPSKALAPLLDLARRPEGPAVLVLGNTVKSAAHARGSGVVEDRADIVFEVRDATDLEPTGRKPWWQELPPAGAEAWAERANRRKRRAKYRLALVPSKFRVGEEPDPFVLELDLSREPWSLRNVTAEITDAADLSETERTAREYSAAMALRDEVGRQETLRGPAIEFLKGRKLTRNAADRIIKKYEGQLWRLVPVEGQRGHGQRLEALPLGPQSPASGGNNPSSETPRQERGEDEGISPGRTPTEGEKSPSQNAAPNAGIGEGALFPPLSSIPSAPAAPPAPALRPRPVPPGASWGRR